MSTPRGEAYRSFFQKLIDELRESHAFTTKRVAQPRNSCHFASYIIPGVDYDAFFAEGGRVAASLLIGLKELEKNRKLFEWLKRDRAAIEAEFGEEMDWSGSKGVVRFSISVYRVGSIDDDEAALRKLHKWFVANLLKFKKVFEPRLLAYSNYS